MYVGIPAGGSMAPEPPPELEPEAETEPPPAVRAGQFSGLEAFSMLTTIVA